MSSKSLNEYSHYMYTIIGICYSSKFVSLKIDFVKDYIFEEMRVDIVTTTHTFFPYKRSSEIKIAMINFELSNPQAYWFSFSICLNSFVLNLVKLTAEKIHFVGRRHRHVLQQFDIYNSLCINILIPAHLFSTRCYIFNSIQKIVPTHLPIHISNRKTARVDGENIPTDNNLNYMFEK